MANISAYFHPDPDNPPTVKGFVAEIEITDEVPVRAWARKFADIQKAYLKAMTKALLRQGKLEVSSGEYASGLVLVPYPERIRKFMDKWGDRAPTEMWKEEHEAEVAAFYRCTCDYRALNLKSKSDVFHSLGSMTCWTKFPGAPSTSHREMCRMPSGPSSWRSGAESARLSGRMMHTCSGLCCRRGGRARPTSGHG
jgi:hypothetical protein